MGEAAEQEYIVVRVILNPQKDGSWAAVAPDYTVVGAGESPDAAIRSATALLEDYFVWCARDGLSASEARRPISRRWRAELWMRLLSRRLLRRVRARPAPERQDVRLSTPAVC